MNRKLPQSILIAAMAAVLVGCNATGAMTPPTAFPTGTAAGKSVFVPNSDAGQPVASTPDPTKLAHLVVSRNKEGKFGTARPDPFALTPQEASFDREQTTERFFTTVGGFSVEVTKKPDVEDEVVAPEPQPYRRLSGIVVGDSILAILEEDGKTPIIVTPGMAIPNSPWRVVSIDQDKAVLRRSGNVKPTEIIVRLETPRFGTAAAGQGQGGPSGPPGGFGGPPPGAFGPPGRGGRGPGGGGPDGKGD